MAVPQSPGIYLLQTPGNPLHLSWCPNLQRRITRLFDPSYTLSGRLRERLAEVACWPAGSKLESLLLLHRLAKSHFPEDYMKRTRLRPPAFLALLHGHGFARLAVVRDIPRKDARVGVWGPFRTREAAEWYGEEVSGLFQLRRCTEVLSPSPEHPGCIYGEMNQCLCPCQARVTTSEYRSEALRVAEFLADNGKAMGSALSRSRDRACEDTDFEQAALIHKRVEKVQAAAAARSSEVTELENFHGVAVTRGNSPHECKLWPMWAGIWQAPVLLDFTQTGARVQSLDSQLREQLTERLASSLQEGKQAEDLSIFARWYFSSSRDGEWLAFDDPKTLNYRKLVRHVSSLVKANSPGTTV